MLEKAVYASVLLQREGGLSVKLHIFNILFSNYYLGMLIFIQSSLTNPLKKSGLGRFSN